MMAASKPTSLLLRLPMSFPTNHDFGTLASRLRCFLFHDDVSTRRVSRDKYSPVFAAFVSLVSRMASAVTPDKFYYEVLPK